MLLQIIGFLKDGNMNNNQSDNSLEYGITYTKTAVCEKAKDTTIVSDCFMNIIKNMTIILQPNIYQEITVKTIK